MSSSDRVITSLVSRVEGAGQSGTDSRVSQGNLRRECKAAMRRGGGVELLTTRQSRAVVRSSR